MRKLEHEINVLRKIIATTMQTTILLFQQYRRKACQYAVYTVTLFSTIFLCNACTVVRFHHVGKLFPPTQNVDVFYAQRDVKAQKYEFIGEILMEVNNGFISSEMEEQLTEQARMRGANGVIVGNLDIRYFANDVQVYPGIGLVSSGEQVGVRIVRGYLLRYLP